jgi:molybdenum cofactor biosynthesis protein B
VSAEDHKKHAPKRARVFVLTISDTRTVETDSSGRLMEDLIKKGGHDVTGYEIVKDEPAEVQKLIRRVAEEGSADIFISSGGTGISHRDSTYEAVVALLDKRLDGFGELFRMLSYQQIGSAAMMSRATAGLLKDKLVVFALPGSSKAVELALEKLILPEMGHLLFEKAR